MPDVMDLTDLLRSGWRMSIVDWDFDEDPEACPGATIEMEETQSGQWETPSFVVTNKISATTTSHRSLGEALRAVASAVDTTTILKDES